MNDPIMDFNKWDSLISTLIIDHGFEPQYLYNAFMDTCHLIDLQEAAAIKAKALSLSHWDCH